MHKIKSVKELKMTIWQLESDQKMQLELLKTQAKLTTESLKPANLLVSALKEILSSPMVALFGIEKIKSFGHKLIDKFFRTPSEGPDLE